MRKVVAFEFLSLDGVADGPDRFFTAWDDVVDEAGAALIATQDAVILGRRSYDEWAAFWPSSDIEPFATFINRRLRRARQARASVAPQRGAADRPVSPLEALTHAARRVQGTHYHPCGSHERSRGHQEELS